MLWLQIFAIIALAGCHRAWGNEDQELTMQRIPFGLYRNSFPYPYITDNKYTSAVVSHSSGPLCSGLHVAQKWVISAASCVYRHPPKDLFVVSRRENTTIIGGDSYEYLQVVRVVIDSLYNFTTGQHNIVIMEVMEPKTKVAVLSLPSLGASAIDERSQVFISKYSYDEKKKLFYPHMLPVEAKVNLNECLENYSNVPMNTYYCVNLVEKTPYSYGLLDLGTGLGYFYDGQVYLMGMFTASDYSSFNNFKTYYLYQNIIPCLEFLYSHVKFDKPSQPDGHYSH